MDPEPDSGAGEPESAPSTSAEHEPAPTTSTEHESAPSTSTEHEPAPSPSAELPPGVAPLFPTSADPERVSPTGWVYPVTPLDRALNIARRLGNGALALVGLLGLVVLIGWAIPSCVAARSDSYAAVCRRAREDGSLQRQLGYGLKCERVPSSYRLGAPEGDEFEFWVQGAYGRARVRGGVVEGEVATFRVLEFRLGF